jgi:uncharacterized protein YceH (UPF0502 family)
VILDPVEGRVVGSLIEKHLTTPQQYPLSLNSLTLACNQTSNRDPVVSYGEADVQSALDSLKAKGLVRFVLPSHGRSVVRYRHVMDEKLALDARQLSLIGVLLLRGPQTVGELRTRTERMADFGGIGEVESDLEGLTKWEDPLVRKSERRPGQKEERWTQLLSEWQGEEPRTTESEGRGEGSATRASLQSQIEELRVDLEALREEVARLKAALGE